MNVNSSYLQVMLHSSSGQIVQLCKSYWHSWCVGDGYNLISFFGSVFEGKEG